MSSGAGTQRASRLLQHPRTSALRGRVLASSSDVPSRRVGGSDRRSAGSDLNPCCAADGLVAEASHFTL